MGASPAAMGAPGDLPRSEVRVAACLSEPQRRALGAELGVVEDGAPGGSSRDARGDGSWEVYYDRIDFALTLRGWWLRERGGEWLLRAPAAEGGYEELSDIEEILERVGLAAYAEAWKRWSEKQRNLEKLLHQASVVPFARFRSHRHASLSVPLPSAGAQGGEQAAEAASLAGPGAELQVGLETLHLDVKFAEDEAVSKLLFTLGGIAARKNLQVSVVELSLTGEALAEKAVAGSARAKLDESLRARGLDVSAGPCPRVMAYVRTLRPAHHRALLRYSAVSSAAGQAAEADMVH